MKPETFVRHVKDMVYDYGNRVFTAREAMKYFTALIKKYDVENKKAKKN